MEITPTFNELAFNINNLVKLKTTSQEPVSLRQIKFNILAVRSRLIEEETNKNYTPDSSCIQTLKCVDVKLVDSSECNCITTGTKILRTVNKIPSVIEANHSSLLTRVGPVNISIRPFSIVPYSRVPYIGLNSFSNKTIYCFLHNGYLYFIGDGIKRLKKINIQGVFENPEDVAEFIDCSGETCYSDDQAFPVKYSMVPQITQIVTDKFFPKTQFIDSSNDGRVDPVQINKAN
jgi:hypothetical protein